MAQQQEDGVELRKQRARQAPASNAPRSGVLLGSILGKLTQHTCSARATEESLLQVQMSLPQ